MCVNVHYYYVFSLAWHEGGCFGSSTNDATSFSYVLISFVMVICFSFNSVVSKPFLLFYFIFLGVGCCFGLVFGWPSDVFVRANEKSRHFNYCNIIVSSFFLFGIIVIVISDYILLDFTTEKKNLENKPTSSNLWYKRAIIIT